MIDSLDYYNTLVEIWRHQDTSFWASLNIFLIIEGMMIVAFFQAKGIEQNGENLGFYILIFGIFITIVWLFSGNRRKYAIRLTSLQGRCLEEKIFTEELGIINKIPTGNVKDYFPMFFTGNHAFFTPLKKSSLKPHEEEIKAYVNNIIKSPKTLKEKIKYFDRCLMRWSESNIMTIWIPLAFLIIWIVFYFYD